MELQEVEVRSILTRTGGYLEGICSHSVQPYRGCSFGGTLCGVGCYVQHNPFVLRGRRWGEFLEVRSNADAIYRRQVEAERRWARRRGQRFALFLSSSTEPFPPQERRYRVTQRLLEAMIERPPDLLVVQSHSPGVVDVLDRLQALAERCTLRLHLSIESDYDRLPGLPPPAASVEQRLTAAAAAKDAGLFTVVTVAPLLPIERPQRFFQRISQCADAVVLDHFIGGDGSPHGKRTRRTRLPEAMAAVDPASIEVSYRDAMVGVARRYLPGRVGVGCAGFAGVYA